MELICCLIVLTTCSGPFIIYRQRGGGRGEGGGVRISLEGLLGFQKGRNIKLLVRVRTKFHFQSYDFCRGIS